MSEASEAMKLVSDHVKTLEASELSDRMDALEKGSRP
jgi:hypothetical protein